MYRKILVGYDGSEGSQAALDHAAEMAGNQGATLIIAYVVKDKAPSSTKPMYQVPYGGLQSGVKLGAETVDEYQEETMIEKDKGEFLLEKARNNLSLSDAQVQTKLIYGDHPDKEICKIASMNNADLIVMGNRGLQGLRKFMLGSISQKVAQNCECPVLIVK